MSTEHQNNQDEPKGYSENDSNNSTQAVNASRRKALKLAIATPPVLMTLTSRPVHAIQGLSNMLSGDTSQCRGDTKHGGMSPTDFWKHYDEQGGADVYGDNHKVAWDVTGYLYGTFDPLITSNEAYKRFTGGTYYNDVFGSGYPGMTLREVLNEESGSVGFHLIAGLLNARYFDYKAGLGGDSLYFMTTDQFWAMYDGTFNVPSGYTSLRDLIESSYHLAPGSTC